VVSGEAWVTGDEWLEVGLLVGEVSAARRLCALLQEADCQARLIGESWVEAHLPQPDVEQAMDDLRLLVSSWRDEFPQARLLLPAAHRFLPASSQRPAAGRRPRQEAEEPAQTPQQ